jgi:hypothetical protein
VPRKCTSFAVRIPRFKSLKSPVENLIPLFTFSELNPVGQTHPKTNSTVFSISYHVLNCTNLNIPAATTKLG